MMHRQRDLRFLRSHWACAIGGLVVVLLLALPNLAGAQEAGGGETAAREPGGHEGGSRITDEVIPLQLEDFPRRPKPLIELGTPFLGTGHISGFGAPGGAVWTPSFLMFGSMRSGISTGTSYNAAGDEITTNQWANRLDLFGNLSFTFTERLVFGLRPIDRTDASGARRFSGYAETKGPAGTQGDFVDYSNFDWGTVSHLFFEGDFGEIFPGLDRSDRHGLDYGLGIGRQPINFQEGTLINDTIDAVGITRNNLKLGGLISLRVTGLVGWNQINRNTPSSNGLLRNREADKSTLVALFTEMDTRAMTINVDGVYVRGGEFVDPDGVRAAAGDGVYAGISFVGRPGGGTKNLAVRFLTSQPVGSATEGPFLGVSDPAARGSLIMSEFSWTPAHSENFYYANMFAAIEDYRAAALDPLVPGPLARVGVLFEGSGLGSPSALSPTASRAVGGAFGHQVFLAHTRQQVILEVAGRYSTLACDGETAVCDPHQTAGGLRYQAALGRRFVFVVDGSVAGESLRGSAASQFGKTWRLRRGARFELLTRF